MTPFSPRQRSASGRATAPRPAAAMRRVRRLGLGAFGVRMFCLLDPCTRRSARRILAALLAFSCHLLLGRLKTHVRLTLFSQKFVARIIRGASLAARCFWPPMSGIVAHARRERQRRQALAKAPRNQDSPKDGKQWDGAIFSSRSTPARASAERFRPSRWCMLRMKKAA